MFRSLGLNIEKKKKYSNYNRLFQVLSLPWIFPGLSIQAVSPFPQIFYFPICAAIGAYTLYLVITSLSLSDILSPL